MVPSDGKRGGLLLLWKKQVTVSLQYKTHNYIDVFVGDDQASVWRFTGLYGEPIYVARQTSHMAVSERSSCGCSVTMAGYGGFK